MELQGTIEVIKSLSEITSPLLIVVFVLWTLYFKDKDSSINTAEKIGNLQSQQLKTLIEQNKELGVELHTVRQELTAAYIIINDMRNRILELESTVKLKEQSNVSVFKKGL